MANRSYMIGNDTNLRIEGQETQGLGQRGKINELYFVRIFSLPLPFSFAIRPS